MAAEMREQPSPLLSILRIYSALPKINVVLRFQTFFPSHSFPFIYSAINDSLAGNFLGIFVPSSTGRKSQTVLYGVETFDHI